MSCEIDMSCLKTVCVLLCRTNSVFKQDREIMVFIGKPMGRSMMISNETYLFVTPVVIASNTTLFVLKHDLFYK